MIIHTPFCPFSCCARSFPGGAMVMNDVLAQFYPFYWIARILAMWIGDAHSIEWIQRFGSSIPSYPAFHTTLPHFPGDMVFNPALGSKALPLEYLMFPPDIYVAKWFTNAKELNSKLLPELYSEVMQNSNKNSSC